jgi:hypothetical protein
MTWEEVNVPAVRGGELVTSPVRFAVGDVCVVEVSVGDDIGARGEGPDLFEALASARRQLEAYGVVVGCDGARRDVFPSAMLRQATGGRRAYVLAVARNAARPQTVDIFAPGGCCGIACFAPLVGRSLPQGWHRVANVGSTCLGWGQFWC